jgi:hypothetical protein
MRTNLFNKPKDPTQEKWREAWDDWIAFLRDAQKHGGAVVW